MLPSLPRRVHYKYTARIPHVTIVHTVALTQAQRILLLTIARGGLLEKLATGNLPPVPPAEQLAFRPNVPGDADLRDIRPDPLDVVVTTLRAHTDAVLLAQALPDLAV